jgi:hypothetical protein
MRTVLRSVADIDREGLWEGDGARDCAHWVQMRFGISNREAHRWIRAAHVLDGLPMLSDALSSGRLGLAKVLEVCRFATPETEAHLVRWAGSVSMGAVRHRADVEVRRTREETVEVTRSRFLETWYSDEGRRFGMEVELPAAEGAIVEQALERIIKDVPTMPDEEGPAFASARRADALVAMASGASAVDSDPAQATVIVHAPVSAFTTGAGAEVESGPPVPTPIVERMLCTSRFQTVVEDAGGNVVALGERSRLAPAWMQRQVRYRDRECRFPGCGARRFTEVHHVAFWRDGGRTTLENLVLICGFHHRLVHEYGWRAKQLPNGDLAWQRPGGETYGHSARGPTAACAA